MAATAGRYEAMREGDTLVLSALGAWTLDGVAALDAGLRRLATGGVRVVQLDLHGLEALDTAGAWLLERTRLMLDRAGVEVTVAGAAPEHVQLLERIAAAGAPPPLPPTRHHTLLDVVERIGRGTIHVGQLTREITGFYGATMMAGLRVLAQPRRRIRFTSFVRQIEQTGFNALPIVGLLSFLIGVVLAYQGVDQLRRFGAEIFTVNLVGLSVLREMGILITAIVVAGRSGSAYAAQIGTMQVNEEVDALRTMGVDPFEVLVLPRVLGLMVAMPLLTFFADMMGILGGGVMCVVLVDLTPAQYLHLLNQAVTATQFWVGMMKAPVFAFIIALVGCFEGLRVTGSAESVGRHTTQAVVESIFLVIVFDALFSVLFSVLHI
jgi:phospholipid/cholesterol/gamma-HCH transport system permease protein